MLKKVRIALFLLLLVQTAQGQWKRDITEMLIPKMAPLTLFDPNTPGFSIGLEFQPHDNFSVQFEYNIPFDALAFFNYNTGKINHQTQRYRGEVRLYPGYPSEAAAWYLAAEGFVTTEKYERENSTLFRDGQLFSFPRGDVQREVFGGALKYGYQFTLNYHFVIDVFGGLGIRQVSITHQPDALFPSELLFDERWGGDQREGTFLRLHLALGMRIGISLFPRY